MKIISKIILLLIILSGIFLRFYKLESVPPSLSWDEASFSYNAYTIANWGKDEWGKVLPFAFKSFGEYKNPVDIYIAVPFIKVFGLNELGTRFPAALFGAVNILLVYLLGKRLFKNEVVGLFAAFSFAISPYNIQFSRHHHELNIALFFYLLGLWSIIGAINKDKVKGMILGFVSLAIPLLTYNAAKIIIPLTVLGLSIIYFKYFIKHFKYSVVAGIIVLGIFLFTFFGGGLSGRSRLSQVAFKQTDIEQTYLYKKTKIRRLGQIELVFKQYPLHFSSEYLLERGDKNYRHSTGVIGEYYKMDVFLMLLGLGYLGYLIIKKKSKEALLLLGVILIAPLPSSIASEAPHAGRTMFMNGSWHILVGLGFMFLVSQLKQKLVKWLVIGLLLAGYGFQMYGYLDFLFNDYAKKYAIDWQYGMKQIVETIKKQDPESVQSVYMTIDRCQPHIFFLYYLGTDVNSYNKTMIVNEGPKSGCEIINSFEKYNFGTWDFVWSRPIQGVYYVLTPNEYSGLAHINDFTVIEKIQYPDGSDAYFIVTSY